MSFRNSQKNLVNKVKLINSFIQTGNDSRRKEENHRFGKMRLHTSSRAFSPSEPVEKGKIQRGETSKLINIYLINLICSNIL